ncbi:MAG: tRNA (guanosine(46)-N7)-methyltransferase TrmB [Mogibacterium sp.]|nr:tRNA (guanosine(46)-N7)-methyltransferase TrmB [Mogibacterium sp.]
MRQRRLRNLDTKYEAYRDLIIEEPTAMRGYWNDLCGGRPLCIEIGCGKGKFISELAAKEPENFFIAIEGNKSVMLRAMEKVRSKGLENVKFLPELAGDLSEWFTDEEVRRIYLNFSDPLPKNYWYKRRLTYRDRLKSYFKVLAEDGVLIFKTDNTEFFAWSLMEIQAADLKIMEITRDLHADPALNADNIETEYEAKYSGLGEKIKRVVIGRKTEGIAPEGKDIMECNINKKTLAAYNGREIPKEDKNFTATGKANAAIAEKGAAAVKNATLGALYDDEGRLVVLESVDKAFRDLNADDFAAYAPIEGTAGFREAIRKAALGSYEPKSFVRVVATPGGTGAVSNAMANYSCPGDRVLTHDWYWGPYKSIAMQQGKSLETFKMFDEEGHFNRDDFAYKVSKLLRNQEHLVIILNTPAGNPTGYSMSMDDWYEVKKVLDAADAEKKIALVVDAAYMDYAGESDEIREFLSVIDNLRANILPIIAYSASKTFTMYGFRCGAMICLAHSPEIADEFEKLAKFTARSTWSNSPRAPQAVIEKIYAEPELLEKTDAERKEWRDRLLARGRAFAGEAAEAGLEIVPFTGGFFVTVPCENPDALCDRLAEQDIYLIPVEGGVRVSVAACSEAKLRCIPKIIKELMNTI